LVAVFLVLSLGAVVVSYIPQLLIFIQERQRSVSSQQELVAKEAAITVANSVQGEFEELEVVVGVSDLTALSQEEQRAVLRGLLGLDPHLRQLILLDSQGRELARTSRLAEAASRELTDRVESDWFAQVRRGNRYISPVYVDEASSEPMVVIAVAATDVFGDFRGVLMVEVTLKFMWDLVGSLEIGEASLAYVVDRQGNLIASGDISRVLRGENVDHLGLVGQFMQSPAPAGEAVTGEMTGINGEAVAATYVSLGVPDWAVVIELPLAEARQAGIQNTMLLIVIMVLMAGLNGGLVIFIVRRLTAPLLSLTETAIRIAGGETGLQADMAGSSEVLGLARAFNSMTTQLRDLIGGLEERVAARTRELEQRTTYLEASAEVARAASSILDVDRLVQQVVELIHQRFGLYYVGLFMVDEVGEWAVLRAGTGEAGQAMLARSHRIKIGEGMVGWCVANGEARIALDVGEDAVRLATADLPDTRSEAALPLRARGHVVGALTVQSDRPAAFDQEIITVFQSMADQVAVALENARLFAESQAALEAAGRAYGELSREAWINLLQTRPDMGYRSAERGVITVDESWRPEMLQALQEKKIVRGDGADEGAKVPLAVPIKVRGEVIGVLDTYKPAAEGGWTDEEVALLEMLTDQLGEALEGARLYHDTQRRAAREQLIGYIVNRMRSAVDMDALMQTTIREVATALGATSAFVQLGVGAGAAGDGDDDEQKQA
jgi:GAF domain-containing protein